MAIGYVLLNVSPGAEHDVYLTLQELKSVSDATVLFGDYDLIVKLEALNLSEIAKAVVEEIRQIAGVLDTKTLAGAEF